MNTYAIYASCGDELKDIISKHDNDANFIPTSTPFVGKNAAFFARSTNDRNRKFKAEYSQINRILKALKAKGVSLRGAESIYILTERGSAHQHRAESRAVFRHLNDIDMVFCSDATRLTRNYDDRSFLKEVFSSKGLFVLIDDDVKQVIFDEIDSIQVPETDTISYDKLGLQDATVAALAAIYYSGRACKIRRWNSRLINRKEDELMSLVTLTRQLIRKEYNTRKFNKIVLFPRLSVRRPKSQSFKDQLTFMKQCVPEEYSHMIVLANKVVKCQEISGYSDAVAQHVQGKLSGQDTLFLFAAFDRAARSYEAYRALKAALESTNSRAYSLFEDSRYFRGEEHLQDQIKSQYGHTSAFFDLQMPSHLYASSVSQPILLPLPLHEEHMMVQKNLDQSLSYKRGLRSVTEIEPAEEEQGELLLEMDGEEADGDIMEDEQEEIASGMLYYVGDVDKIFIRIRGLIGVSVYQCDHDVTDAFAHQSMCNCRCPKCLTSNWDLIKDSMHPKQCVCGHLECPAKPRCECGNGKVAIWNIVDGLATQCWTCRTNYLLDRRREMNIKCECGSLACKTLVNGAPTVCLKCFRQERNAKNKAMGIICSGCGEYEATAKFVNGKPTVCVTCAVYDNAAEYAKMKVDCVRCVERKAEGKGNKNTKGVVNLATHALVDGKPTLCMTCVRRKAKDRKSGRALQDRNQCAGYGVEVCHKYSVGNKDDNGNPTLCASCYNRRCKNGVKTHELKVKRARRE